MTTDATVHVTLSGDIFLKSRRTQKGLIARVRANLTQALHNAGYDGQMTRIGTHRFELDPSDDTTAAVISAAQSVFGIGSVDVVREVTFSTMDDLADAVARITEDRIKGRTFAVRVKRRGTHEWRSPDLAIATGSLLVKAGGSVDLTTPQEEVHVTVLERRAFVVSQHTVGAGGLPIGTQDRVLCLLSGGFDSVVAAWMMMSRGCPVDFVHFSLNCAQSDHALAVASELHKRWGAGTSPEVHLVEFQPVKDALVDDVDARMRQITLKMMMARAASDIAQEAGITALLTGDAMGQVSSQTLPHLVAVSNATETPVLRPLLGLPKQTIIDLARDVGTADLSARAQEVCDLSEGGPVATASSESAVASSVEQVPAEVVVDAVATRKSFKLTDWSPGQL